MAELDLPGVVMNQEYRVKLGKSFTIPRENAFHTIKYDFKPLSVDNSKPGKLRVGEGDEVNMSLPVVQAESADDVAQFRGPKRPCARECVLVINTETGEAVLEKIGSSVNLKSVRDGRPKPARDRSISPAPFASKNQSAIGKMHHTGKSTSVGSSSSSSSHKRSKVSKMLTKSRAGKSSSEGGGSSLKHSQTAGGGGGGGGTGGGGEVVSKPRKKQLKIPKVKPNRSHSDLPPQSSSSSSATTTGFLTLPKIGTGAPPTAPPTQTTNEANPSSITNNQVGGQNQVSDARKRTLEDSSGSSSGSASSSSSGSSDSESEEEQPFLQPAFLSHPATTTAVTAGAAAFGAGVLNKPSMQPPQLSNRVPPSMPVFGGGPTTTSGGVPISIPPFPVQPSRNEDSSSSSGSGSDSSSDSSSGSSSDSSDNEMAKIQGNSSVAHQQSSQNLTRSISTLEHELSCSSSESD